MTFYFYIMQSKKERYIININAKKENQKEALTECITMLLGKKNTCVTDTNESRHQIQ